MFSDENNEIKLFYTENYFILNIMNYILYELISLKKSTFIKN